MKSLREDAKLSGPKKGAVIADHRINCLALTLVLIFALSACQQQPTPAASTADQPSTVVATSTAGDVGIAECDDYLNKYQACVLTKAPQSARATLKQSLDQTRAVWRTASTTPSGKAGLAAACKQAREASRASLRAYGCAD